MKNLSILHPSYYGVLKHRKTNWTMLLRHLFQQLKKNFLKLISEFYGFLIFNSFHQRECGFLVDKITELWQGKTLLIFTKVWFGKRYLGLRCLLQLSQNYSKTKLEMKRFLFLPKNIVSENEGKVSPENGKRSNLKYWNFIVSLPADNFKNSSSTFVQPHELNQTSCDWLPRRYF